MSGTIEIFFCCGGNECIRKQPSYMRRPLYFAALLHRIAKLIAVYRAEELTSAVLSYVPLKEVAHGMVCLSESH